MKQTGEARQALERLLLKCFLQYRQFVPPDEQLRLTACHWQELLADTLARIPQDRLEEVLERAFMRHMESETVFPLPQAIRQELAVEIAIRRGSPGKPSKGQGTRTPGMGRLVLAALRGDPEARKKLADPRLNEPAAGMAERQGVRNP